MSYSRNSNNGRGGDRRDQINRNTPMATGPRLPVPHEALLARKLTPESWNVLVDAIFPSATSAGAVLLALDYCAARRLDPFKKPVHIVPVYNKALSRMVETVWPGINSLQTDAARTKEWAGMDPPAWGPMVTKRFTGKLKKWESGYENWEDVEVEMTFPEFCSVTVYRLVNGTRCPFTSPVYWEEAYATQGGTKVPNDMWQKRPRGQLQKNALAASLRAAFPEDADTTAEEMEGQTIDGGGIVIRGEAEEVPEPAPSHESRAPVDAPAEPAQPWGDMAWPFSKDGKAYEDMETVDAWSDRFRSRLEKIKGAKGLDNGGRARLIGDLNKNNQAVFDALREGGGKAAVADVEAMIDAAAKDNEQPASSESEAPPERFSILGHDGNQYEIGAKGNSPAEAEWLASWKFGLGEIKTIDKLRQWRADNDPHHATMRKNHPDTAQAADEAVSQRMKQITDDFPGDRPSRAPAQVRNGGSAK